MDLSLGVTTFVPDLNSSDPTFVDKIDDSYICGICHRVFRDPYQIISCGHTFCKSCIDTYLKFHLYESPSQMRISCPKNGCVSTFMTSLNDGTYVCTIYTHICYKKSNIFY